MANWWDRVTDGLGDTLLGTGTQSPFGALLPPMTPEQRSMAYGPALLGLSASLYNSARRGAGPLEALGQGVQDVQTAGQQRTMQQLQTGILASKIKESQRKNETMEMLARTRPPEGVDPDVWRGMVATDPGAAFKLYIEANKDARTAAAYTGGAPTGGMGVTGAGAPTSASGTTYDGNPQVYTNNIGNLIKTGTPWEGKGDPYAHPRLKGMQFETFADPVQGVSAAYKNVLYHVKNSGVRSFEDLGAVLLGGKAGQGQYRPPRPDGGNDDSSAWAAAVSRAAGLRPGDPIPVNDPQAMARVMRGINLIEHGRETVPADAYLAGVTGQRPQASAPPPGSRQERDVWDALDAAPAERRAGVTAALRADPATAPHVASWEARNRTGAPVVPVQASGGQPAPVAPSQATAPQAPAQQQPTAIDPRQDPEIRRLTMLQGQHLRARNWKEYGDVTAQIAKREGQLADTARSGPDLVEVWDDKAKRVVRVPKSQGVGTEPPSSETMRRSAENQDFGDDKNLREEYTTRTKDYRDMRTHWQRVVASAERPSPAGDISLVFAYMKMLDPTSAVREGEQATVANAGSIDQRITALYNRLLTTSGRMDDATRADFVDRAARLYDRSYGEYEDTRRVYTDLARQYRRDPSRIVLDYTAGVQRPTFTTPDGRFVLRQPQPTAPQPTAPATPTPATDQQRPTGSTPPAQQQPAQPQTVPPSQVLMDAQGNRYTYDPATRQWKDMMTGAPYVPPQR